MASGDSLAWLDQPLWRCSLYAGSHNLFLDQSERPNNPSHPHDVSVDRRGRDFVLRADLSRAGRIDTVLIDRPQPLMCRRIAKERNPSNFELPFPLPFRFDRPD
jgi:hypothetical protein